MQVHTQFELWEYVQEKRKEHGTGTETEAETASVVA